jgi:hypothetical protein
MLEDSQSYRKKTLGCWVLGMKWFRVREDTYWEYLELKSQGSPKTYWIKKMEYYGND